jgi:hypothetical protein
VLYAYQEQLDPKTGRVLGYKPIGFSGSASSPIPQGNNPLTLNPNTKGYTFIGPTQSQSLVASTSSTGSNGTINSDSVRVGSAGNGTSVMDFRDLNGTGNIILMSGANPQSPATIPP